MSAHILTEDQAAKVCDALRALSSVSTYTSIMVPTEHGSARVYTTRFGAVHVDGPNPLGAPAPIRCERFPSEAAFAVAYGQSADGLMPF